MMDLKVMNSALEQLEDERGIPKEKIIEAIEGALAAAYKKDYGKKGQIIRADFDINTGKVEFSQVKIVVDDTTVKMPDDLDEEEDEQAVEDDKKEKVTAVTAEEIEEEDLRPRFNPEQHILIEDAKKIKKDAELEEEIVFPLEAKDDYGRIAAQTAKQVIIQKIREAEKVSVLDEYTEKQGEIVSGVVQRIERGNVFIDLGRTVGILPAEEQIPGEHYRQGGRVKAYVYDVSEGPRGINIRLSRTHPEFLKKLFEIEAPEIANEVVEIKSVAREPGSRSKIAVLSYDERVDPIGACVGQRGIRVSTVMNELAGEKIDIIEWSEDHTKYIAGALSPAKISSLEVFEDEKRAVVSVPEDQLSLAIGKGGQNVRLAAKLTGWKIDVLEEGGETVAESDGDNVEIEKEDVVEVEKQPEKEPKESEEKEDEKKDDDDDTKDTDEDNASDESSSEDEAGKKK